MEDGMITKGNWNSFLTAEGERLRFVRRRHPIVAVFPALLVIFLAVLFGVIAFSFFVTFIFLPFLFLITILLLVSITLTIISGILTEWYYHVYVLTTKRILEMRYTPLFSNTFYDILLDKVNCTEIDLKNNGLINQLFNKGDIIITFDRPTHQQELVLKDIQKCNKLYIFLTKELLDRNREFSKTDTIWLNRPFLGS